MCARGLAVMMRTTIVDRTDDDEKKTKLFAKSPQAVSLLVLLVLLLILVPPNDHDRKKMDEHGAQGAKTRAATTASQDEVRITVEWLASPPLRMDEEPLAVREALVKALRDNKVRYVSELLLLAANAGSAPNYDGSIVLNASFSEALLGEFGAKSYRETLKFWGALGSRSKKRGMESTDATM